MRWLLVLALVGCSSWSKGDYARQVVFAAEMAVDLHQTNTIIQNCDETNPIIGPCGEHVNLTQYFISAFIVHTILIHILLDEPRRAVQYLSIGAEGATILRNTQLEYQ